MPTATVMPVCVKAAYDNSKINEDMMMMSSLLYFSVHVTKLLRKSVA